MAKVRVHELTKKLGITSKKLLEILKESSEFVKSTSSIIEAPVVRRAHEYTGTHPRLIEKRKKSVKKPTSQAKASKSGERAIDPDAEKADDAKFQSPSRVRAPEGRDAPGGDLTSVQAPPTAERTASRVRSDGTPASGPRSGPAAAASSSKAPAEKTDEPREATGTKAAKPVTPKPGTPEPSTSKPAGDKPKVPRPSNPREKRSDDGGPEPQVPRLGSSPFTPAQGTPHPGGGRPKSQAPCPDNNPFASTQGMPRPDDSQRQQGRSRSQSGSSCPRSDAQRPNPSMMSGRSPTRPTERSSSGGSRGCSKDLGRGGPGGPGNRGDGFTRSDGKSRGDSTADAFGRQGGYPSRGHKSRRAKHEESEAQPSPMVASIEVPRGDESTVVRVRAGTSLADFAERIDASSTTLIAVLFRVGEMTTTNQSLDEDTFTLSGAELDHDVQILSSGDEDRGILKAFGIGLEVGDEVENDKDFIAWPPAVTVIGHVDHDKTKLLGAIRSAHVVDTEHDDITWHIGTYQAYLDYGGQDRTIASVDILGHETFTQIRARGADVTDIAVLAVAVDGGVMPQTIGAVNHAQAADVRIVVVVNKIDIDGVDPEKIHGQLAGYGAVVEECGGDTMFVNISVELHTDINDPLEAILYTADADPDLRTNPNRDARDVTVKAKLNQDRDAVVTALIQMDTLRIGDSLVIGATHGRVKAMFDDGGGAVKKVEPSRPVQVLRVSMIPAADDSFLVMPGDCIARQIADKRGAAQRVTTLTKRRKRISLESLNNVLKQETVQTLNLIIKGDAPGSVEALESSLLKLEVDDEVVLQVIHRDMGTTTQNDINLATVDNATIIGFNIHPAERVQEIVDRENVDMELYSVIYSAIEDVKAAPKDILKLIFEEV